VRFAQVEKENKALRAELDKREGLQSAFQSNNKAYYEKVEQMDREARDA
jgi:hypothetical protein